MSDSRFDSKDEDLVGRLIRTSGRGPTPPPGARERVYAAVHAEWRRNTASEAATPAADRRRTRRPVFDWLGFWLRPGLAVAAAAAIAIGVGSLVGRSPDVAPVVLASLGRTIGDVSIRTPDGELVSRPAAGMALVGGTRLVTGDDAGVALRLASGESVRLNADTEIVLAAAGNVELAAGTLYLDSDPDSANAAAVVVTTRYGDVRHIGTQYEVDVGESRLRVRVREGAVAIATDAERVVGNAGEQVVVPPGGDAVTTEFARTDPAWEWTAALAMLPEAPAYPVSDVLGWVARQTGREVEYASTDGEQRAATLELNGVAGLTPDEIIEVVQSTTNLAVRLDETRIVVD